MGLLHHPSWLQHVETLLEQHFPTFETKYFVWLMMADEGSVSEMRIWSMLLIQYD